MNKKGNRNNAAAAGAQNKSSNDLNEPLIGRE